MNRKSRITETVLIFNIIPRLTDDETFRWEVEFLDRLVSVLNDLYRAIRAVPFYIWPTENVTNVTLLRYPILCSFSLRLSNRQCP